MDTVRVYVGNVDSTGINAIHCKVYSSSSTPPTTEFTECYNIDNVQLKLHHSDSDKYENHHPVSSCHYSARSQNYQFTNNDIELFKLATNSTKGMYKKRLSMGNSTGSLTYLGLRSPRAVTMPTVCEGPKMSARMPYNSLSSNSIFFPYLVRKGNFVAENTASATRFLYKYMDVSDCFPTTHLWTGDFVIVTVDFSNSPHVDKYDCFPELKNAMIQELQQVTNSPISSIPKIFHTQAETSLQFIEDFNNPSTTTCAYQYVGASPDYTHRDSRSHCYFVNLGLRVAYKIFNYSTITFCGSTFVHNTSVPLYLEPDGDSYVLYVGSKPDVRLFAWGNSKNKNSSGGGGAGAGAGAQQESPLARATRRTRQIVGDIASRFWT